MKKEGEKEEGKGTKEQSKEKRVRKSKGVHKGEE